MEQVTSFPSGQALILKIKLQTRGKKTPKHLCSSLYDIHLRTFIFMQDQVSRIFHDFLPSFASFSEMFQKSGETFPKSEAAVRWLVPF